MKFHSLVNVSKQNTNAQKNTVKPAQVTSKVPDSQLCAWTSNLVAEEIKLVDSYLEKFSREAANI